MRSVVLLVVLAALGLSACGGGDVKYKVGDCLPYTPEDASDATASKPDPLPCDSPKALSKIVKDNGDRAVCETPDQKILNDPGDTEILYCVGPK